MKKKALAATLSALAIGTALIVPIAAKSSEDNSTEVMLVSPETSQPSTPAQREEIETAIKEGRVDFAKPKIQTENK